MKANRSIPNVTVIPVLLYPDVRRAVDWLCNAFGFTERLQIGEGHRSQLNVGDGAVILGEAINHGTPPTPGEVSHEVMVRINDIDAHCKHAREYEARILKKPTDYMYGERQYTAKDPAGHVWTFTATIKDVDPQDWGGVLK